MATTKPTKHQVTKKEVMDAIGYFHGIGMIHNHTGDSEHYIKILLRKVANDYRVLLTLDNNKIL